MAARASGRVCVVGSANLDLIALTNRLPSPGETVLAHGYLEAPGGKGLNQAVAAARAGAQVSFVGAVGADDAGIALKQAAEGDGIDTSYLESITGTPTGRALIGVGDDGANLIIVVPGANSSVDAEVVADAALAITNADVLLVQHEIPDDAIGAALRVARDAGTITILNPAPAHPIAPEILALVDVLVPNEHEHAAIGDVSRAATVVVTEGEHGARVIEASGERRVAPFRVDAVDTVAAGDAFCGALAAALARGVGIDDALIQASAAGALATTVRGATPSLPYASQIEALIAAAR